MNIKTVRIFYEFMISQANTICQTPTNLYICNTFYQFYYLVVYALFFSDELMFTRDINSSQPTTYEVFKCLPWLHNNLIK